MSESRITIATFDPGGTTGYTFAELDDFRIRVIQAGQLGPHEHHLELWDLLHSLRPNKIVCEDFVYQIRRNKGTEMPGVVLVSRDYIGVIKLYSQQTDTYLKMNPPSVIDLKWVDNDALKTLNLYRPNHRHQNDASRHLVHFVVQGLKRRGLVTPLRKGNT